MATTEVLRAELRESGGTGEARRTRRIKGMMPGIIYGTKDKPLAIQIAHKDMMKALENESFHTHLLTVEVDSKKEQVILKDLQRHPAKDQLLHADFFRVSADHKLTIKVPLHYIHEDKCEGIKVDGGMLIRSINEVEVSCLPADIPEYIEVDVQSVRLGEHIHLSDIEWPQGVKSVDLSYGEEHNLSVVTVSAQRVEEEEVAPVDEEQEIDTEADATPEGEREEEADKED